MKLIFRSTFTRNVAYPGLILLITLSVACAFFPERSNMVLTHIQNWIYANLSWSYILIVSFFLIFLFVLAFSKIGNIRLGADNSAPQYSFFSWIAMHTCSTCTLKNFIVRIDLLSYMFTHLTIYLTIK